MKPKPRIPRPYRRTRKYDLSLEQIRLFEDNRGLVWMMARRYTRSGGIPALDEAVQVGTIALLNAAELFRPECRVAFSTYACKAIRQAIQHQYRRNLKHLRRRSELSRMQLRCIAAPGPGPEDEASGNDRSERVKSLIAQLDARSRRIVEGRIFEGLAMADLARELRLSKQRIQQIEVKAVERLKRLAATYGK